MPRSFIQILGFDKFYKKNIVPQFNFQGTISPPISTKPSTILNTESMISITKLTLITDTGSGAPEASGSQSDNEHSLDDLTDNTIDDLTYDSRDDSKDDTTKNSTDDPTRFFDNYDVEFPKNGCFCENYDINCECELDDIFTTIENKKLCILLFLN